MLLQAALNGNRDPIVSPSVPVDAVSLATDAKAAVALGAGAIHLHPRDEAGCETLDTQTIDATVSRVRAACAVPVGVSTGAWMEPDPELRVKLIQSWRAPDYASVNLSEAGALDVMAACERAGTGIEAGVWSVDDAELLASSRFAKLVVRVLIELIDVSAEEATRRASAVHKVLDRRNVTAPRLQHGEGAATWPMLRDAVLRGLDVRIGLEDTLELPDGSPAAGNAELIRAAIEMIRRAGGETPVVVTGSHPVGLSLSRQRGIVLGPVSE